MQCKDISNAAVGLYTFVYYNTVNSQYYSTKMSNKTCWPGKTDIDIS